MAGASNDGGEDSPGGIISGETGFAHAGAIVNDKSGGIFVTHVVLADRVEVIESIVSQSKDMLISFHSFMNLGIF